jgi:hypothetical protein
MAATRKTWANVGLGAAAVAAIILAWIFFNALTSSGSFDTAVAMALGESLLGIAGERTTVTPAMSLQNVPVFPAALAGSARSDCTANTTTTQTMEKMVRVFVLNTGAVPSSRLTSWSGTQSGQS